MRKYERYKDSGIEWLGTVPEHWKISHVKRVCKRVTDGAHTSPDMSSENYPFISVVNLKNDILDFKNCLFTSEKDYIQLVRNGCQPQINDVLYSKDGTIGETYVIKKNKRFVVGSSFIIATPNIRIISSLYLKYYLNSRFSDYLARTFVKGTGIPRLAIFNFNRIYVLIPPIREQIEIANYLDSETQLIDKKVELLSKKIETYKELRKSLINKAVCRGLDNDVKLKESGIDWIGKIPEHWVSYRLKDIGFLYSGLSGKSGNDFYQEDNPNNKSFIPYTNIFNNSFIQKELMGSVVVFETENQNKVKLNDIFFLMSSEDYEGLGKSSLLKENLKDTYLNSCCIGCRIKKQRILPECI